MENRKLIFEFDDQEPQVGDKIVKAFYSTHDTPLGTVKTIVEDNYQTNYHMKCADGFGYNKRAEHGWRRLIKIDYES